MFRSSPIRAAACFGPLLAVFAPAFEHPTVPAGDDDRAQLESEFQATIRPFLEDFCIACHSGDDADGKLDLERFDSYATVAAENELWHYLARRVELDQMPPPGEYAPTDEERAALTGWVGRALRLRYDPALAPDPGPPTLRRLTRAQAQRAVQHLFGATVDASKLLPPDGVALDFTGIGSAQRLPAGAVPGLLDFASQVARTAVVFDAAESAGVHRATGRELDPRRGGFMASRDELELSHEFPRAGSYQLRFGAWADQAGPELARAALLFDDASVAEFEVVPERGDPAQVHRFDLTLKTGGRHSVAVSFVNDYYRPEADDPGERDRNLAVEWIEIAGPFEPPLLPPLVDGIVRRFGLDLTATAPRGRRADALEALATAVWRRPPARHELDRLVELSLLEEPLGAGLRLALEGLIASPNFWFRIERDESSDGPVRALDGYELATRLSFWLWSSAPDDELLARAANGSLQDAEGLAAAVDRLLRSPKSSALAEDFLPQWLALDRLRDRSVPAADGATDLVPSMLRESELLFEAVLREGLPLVTLLDADFTFVDAPLAEHYGLAGIRGPFMRRVDLGPEQRRGILGHASVLTATSDPARTSPVLRGKWILDALLGTPPLTPPDDVPALAGEAALRPTSLRDQLERHRATPTCAVCHETMDPLGFALEGFGPTGQLRRFDGPAPIDDRGELPDGRTVQGADGLMRLIADDPRFLRTFVEKQLTFAIGRPLAAGDRGEVARIVADLDPSTATIRDVVQAVARTHAFRFRRTPASTIPEAAR